MQPGLIIVQPHGQRQPHKKPVLAVRSTLLLAGGYFC